MFWRYKFLPEAAPASGDNGSQVSRQMPSRRLPARK